MIDTILSQTRDRMNKAVDATTQDVATVRTGRATPSLVENISVAAYGGTQRMKVMEMATITANDARTLTISPYDISTIHEIEKGIQEVNSGLTPVVDGEILRITIPPLTEERRKEFIKLIKTKIEAGKVMVRQVRQEAMHEVKREVDEKTMNEDQKKTAEKLIQEVTDKTILELEVLENRKQTELMQI
jgi:ribosome recycling factor